MGHAGETWVFSSQHADVTDGKLGRYYPTWYITAEGDMYLKGESSFDGEVTLKNRLNIDTHIFDSYGHGIVNISSSNFVLGLDKYNNGLSTYLEGGTVFLQFKNNLQIRKGTATRFTFDNFGWNFSGIDNSYVNRDTLTSAGGFVLNANDGKNALYLHCTTAYALCTFSCHGDLKLNFHTMSGAAALYVNSSGIITTSSSSKRYKENITENISEELDYMKVLDIPVCQYNYKSDYKDKELVSGTQIGLIAEDVLKYFPNAAILNENGQAETWQDRIILSALLGVCKRQQQEINALKKEQHRLFLIEYCILFHACFCILN